MCFCGWAGESVIFLRSTHTHTHRGTAASGSWGGITAHRLPACLAKRVGKKQEEICFLSSPILSVSVQTSCILSTSCLLLTHTDGCFSLIQTLSLSLCSTLPSSLHLTPTFLKSYRMLSSTKGTLLLEQKAQQ